MSNTLGLHVGDYPQLGASYRAQKEVPHDTPRGFASVRLNGQVAFGHAPTMPIECSDFATQWLISFLRSPNNKVDYRRFETPAAIRETVTGSVRKLYFDVSRAPSAEIALVKHATWGKWFANFLSRMEKDGLHAAGLLLSTHNHAMAVGLKTKGDGTDRRFSIAFYDPYRTATHVKVISGRLPYIETLSAPMFVDEGGLDNYYGQTGVTCMQYLTPAFLDAVLTTGCTTVHGRPCVAMDAPLSSETLCMLFSHNCISEIEELSPRILSLPERERRDMLSFPTDHPVLHSILHRGTGDAVRLFGVLLSSLPADIRDQILPAKSSSGLPGLCTALLHGVEDTIPAYCEVVQANATGSARTAILSAEFQGSDALIEACKRGRTQSVISFLVATRFLQRPVRTQLPRLRQCLAIASGRGHEQMTAALVDEIALLSFPQARSEPAKNDQTGSYDMRRHTFAGKKTSGDKCVIA